MSIRRKLIAIFALIYFVLSTTNAEERIAYKKHLSFPHGYKPFSSYNIFQQSDEYQNLTYILCDFHDDGLLEHKSERNCTVVQDTQPERSCSVTLKDFNDRDDLEIFSFGSTRAVIFWSKFLPVSQSELASIKSPIKCIILDFSTCKKKEVVLKESFNSIHRAYFAAYDDSFDLVTDSITERNVQNKYHVDVEGNIIFSQWKNLESGRIRDAKKSYRAIVANSKLKAYLHFSSSLSTCDQHSVLISLIKPDGWSKLLAIYRNENTAFGFQKVESTAHQMIGVAFAHDNRVDVLQFDQEGELKLNTSIPYGITVKHVALRNLADGGFLLFTTGSSKKSTSLRESIHSDTYYLTKVNPDGKVIGTIKKEPEPECAGDRLRLQVFDNEAQEYCTVVACHDSIDLEFDLIVKCVSDEDFSKSKSTV